MPTPNASATTPATAVAAGLIDDIVERFHETHRADLSLLRKGLAALVSQGVGMSLQRPLDALADALEEHMFKEEMRLFPMMLQGGNRLVPHLIADLEAEHLLHRAAIDDLAGLLRDVSAGPDTAPALAAVRDRFRKLQDDLQAHIRTEDEVLFPMFDGVAPRF